MAKRLNIAEIGGGVKNLAIGVGILGVLYVGYRAWKGAEAVAAEAKQVVTKGLNPTSQENYANRAFNSVFQTITGDPNATLGTKIYDWLNGVPRGLSGARSRRRRLRALIRRPGSNQFIPTPRVRFPDGSS